MHSKNKTINGISKHIVNVADCKCMRLCCLFAFLFYFNSMSSSLRLYLGCALMLLFRPKTNFLLLLFPLSALMIYIYSIVSVCISLCVLCCLFSSFRLIPIPSYDIVFDPFCFHLFIERFFCRFDSFISFRNELIAIS